MSETVICDEGLSTAEAAIRYAIERVINDANYRYYTLHTETLWRMLNAEAERRGVTYEDIEGELFEAIDARSKSQGKPLVCEQREMIHKLEGRIVELESGPEFRRVEPGFKPSKKQQMSPLEYLQTTESGSTSALKREETA